MTGILSVCISKGERRQKCVKMETIGGVLFRVARVKLKKMDGLLDKLYLMSVMSELRSNGIYRLAAFEHPYIKGLLERYNMTEVSHLPLLRALSGPILMKAAEELSEVPAISIYARKIDGDVMRCIRLACDKFKNVQLDLGTMTEKIRRQMMEENGSSPLIGELEEEENPRVRVFFDRPADPLRLHAAMTLNLSGRAIDFTDCYDDIEAELSDERIPDGTDTSGVLAEIVKNRPEETSVIRIVSLVKKS